MRVVNQHAEAPLLEWVTQSVDTMAVFRKSGARMRRWLRHRMCGVVNGGHELYRAHTDTKLYQQCLLCGYETRGWTIDRRDR
jgi:hypothetical protein